MEHAEKHAEHAEKNVEHARTGKRPCKPRSQTEQQHNINSAGTSLLMAEKSEGLVIAVLASAVRMNDATRSIKELPFSCVPSPNEGWWTAEPGSEQVVNPMNRS